MEYTHFKELFSNQGKIEQVFLQRQQKQGRRCRFGFVQFADNRDDREVIKNLNLKKVNDFIRVGWAKSVRGKTFFTYSRNSDFTYPKVDKLPLSMT